MGNFTADFALERVIHSFLREQEMDRFKDSKGGVEQREKHKLCIIPQVYW